MVTAVVVPDLVFVTGSIASTTPFNSMRLYTWQRAGLADQVGPDANAKTRRAVRAVTGGRLNLSAISPNVLNTTSKVGPKNMLPILDHDHDHFLNRVFRSSEFRRSCAPRAFLGSGLHYPNNLRVDLKACSAAR